VRPFSSRKSFAFRFLILASLLFIFLECLGASYLEYFNERINSKHELVKLVPRQVKKNVLHSKSEYFLKLGASTLDL